MATCEGILFAMEATENLCHESFSREKRRRWNIIYVGSMVFFVYTFAVVVGCTYVLTSIRNLQKEVDVMNQTLMSLQSVLKEDLIRYLQNAAIQQQLVDDITTQTGKDLNLQAEQVMKSSGRPKRPIRKKASMKKARNNTIDALANFQRLQEETTTSLPEQLQTPIRNKRSIIEATTPFENFAESYTDYDNIRIYRPSLGSGMVIMNPINNREEDDVIFDEHIRGNVRRQRQRLLSPYGQSYDEVRPRYGRIKPLPAVHYDGDTSSYDIYKHAHYKGNGHICHQSRDYADWKETSWVNNLGMDEFFDFSKGTITIKDSGMYFVYAQIYYFDTHEINAYRVYKNEETFLQCTVTSHSHEGNYSGNTCYTAGVTYLVQGDKVKLTDLSDGRYSLFETGKSFFGIIKLGDIRL